MLTLDELKSWLHKDISKRDKALLALASMGQVCQVADIIKRGRDAGLSSMKNLNVSQYLSGSNGLAIRTPKGWEITEAGKQHLRTLGVSKISPAAVQIATDLRHHVAKVADAETKKFVEEAIQCYELELYRPAVVMSWLAAVHVLKTEVLNNHLAAFNAEAKKHDEKWKPAKTLDDIGVIKESKFLDRLQQISAIGKNVKSKLVGCLDFRNGCGHPNSLRVGPNMVASHLETLLLNVFQPFAK